MAIEYRINPQIGEAKYSVSWHDGVKKHKDGSKFFDIAIFKSKAKMNKFLAELTKEK
jgi:hypothetical protein